MTRTILMSLLAASLAACTMTDGVSRDATQQPPTDDRAELRIHIPGVLP